MVLPPLHRDKGHGPLLVLQTRAHWRPLPCRSYECSFFIQGTWQGILFPWGWWFLEGRLVLFIDYCCIWNNFNILSHMHANAYLHATQTYKKKNTINDLASFFLCAWLRFLSWTGRIPPISFQHPFTVRFSSMCEPEGRISLMLTTHDVYSRILNSKLRLF